MEDKEKIKTILEIIVQSDKVNSYYSVPEEPSARLMTYFSRYHLLGEFIKEYQELFSIYGITASQFGDIFYNNFVVYFKGW